MNRQPFTRARRTRRQFLATTAVVAGSALVARTVPAEDVTAPQEKLNLGIIGVGGRGAGNLADVSGENIVALCDVNHQVLNQTAARFPQAATYHDWRELIKDAEIDAVVISTADHHHALAAIAAMRAGKHVYCEKPLAATVQEARLMQREYGQRRDKLVTQMGTQIHATENYRRVVELVQAGAIGPVREAHVWCGRSISPIGKVELDPQPEPGDFSWDLWLGPAPARPYNAGYWRGGNLNWNRRWDFGNGVLGDMGSHLIDLPFWALELRHPLSVQSEGPAPDPHACPPWQVVTWQHPARSGNPVLNHPVEVVWYHGPEGMRRRSERLQPQLKTDTDLGQWFIGVAFVGNDGLLVTDYDKHLLSPADQFAQYERPQPSIPRSVGHHREWLEACKKGSPTTCNFDYSGVLIEHNLLGNVAHRSGTRLEWDAESGQITNHPQANELLTRSYREGWNLL